MYPLRIQPLPLTRAKRLFSHVRRSAEGAEIAEAALVLPLLFTFILGIIWFGRAFNIYSTIARAAEQGAITAARPNCATCNSTVIFPSDSAVQTAVVNILQASSPDPTQIQTTPAVTPQSCPTPYPATACSVTTNNITVCRNVLLTSVGQIAQCGAIVSFRYPFQVLHIPFTSIGPVIMTAQAQSRMEN